MSHKSAINDAVNTRPHEQHTEKKAIADLNKIMQQCLLQYGAINQDARPVVRCGNLPEVEADENVFIRLFDLLMQSILNHPPPGRRLFLHIDCERLKKMPADLSSFHIDFYTNIIVSDNWIETYSQALALCQKELGQNNAVLQINYIPAHGCLYSLGLALNP